MTPNPTRHTRLYYAVPADGNLLETTTYAVFGESETSRYHIVGSTMIVNKPKNDLNLRFKVEGNSLIMDTGEYSMLL